MTKRMLVDCTHEEETRVVIVDNNKLEDVEFETINKRPIKGNIYLAKVMRVEPSLQACFVDYGGNKHGFLAYGEIHSDYFNVSDEELAAIALEVDASIEAKKNRNNHKEEAKPEKTVEKAVEVKSAEATAPVEESATETQEVLENQPEDLSGEPKKRKRFLHRRPKNKKTNESADLPAIACATGFDERSVRENSKSDDDFDDDDDDDLEEDDENNCEVLKKLMISRKLFYKHKIQEVIKEGQILLIQVVKEERGNKGAALTTYLSLAGRYCVLMPNRVKSGGVSRKITNQSDRRRLKEIVSELPLNSDMSMIVRTAGEEKTRQDITRDYNYLIRTWNNVREEALKAQAPSMVHEEGNLIKRALRDMYNKEISEIMVDGYQGYQGAKEFFKILAPHNLKKIKLYKNGDIPMFQRYQVEGQLDKLHDPVAQLESGGYVVINPTEALVSIDVNSGRATKEKDLEETALKTNLEACDEIAKQLRIRNLAGLVVIDFIDMAEHKNNVAIEKRMKEALKKDRSKIQVGKMSIFGLLELSRQRMHSSFFESTYQPCPHCQGRGIIRSKESAAMLILRGLEEEGSKNRSSKVNVWVPTDIALYLLNAKRRKIFDIEQKYKLEVCINADDSILNIADYRTEKIKVIKNEAAIPCENICQEEPEEPKKIVKEPIIDSSVEKKEDVAVEQAKPASEKKRKGKANWWKKLVKSDEKQ